jgi:hypothetical protein
VTLTMALLASLIILHIRRYRRWKPGLPCGWRRAR